MNKKDREKPSLIFSDTLIKVKNFWDERPCNIRHSPKVLGTLEYFEEVKQRRYFVEGHIKEFVDFPHWKSKTVLEIGCGIGTDAIEFALAGAYLTAVELSPQSMEIAKRRFAVYGLKGEFIEANVEELSKLFPPPRPYDLIYSFGVIHHTPDPLRALCELRKFCGPSTELRIMLYSKWSWKALWIIITYGKGKFWCWRELVARFSEAQEGSPITFVYSHREIKKLLKKAGFTTTKLKKYFIFPYEISAYRKYQYIKVWYFRWMPNFIFELLQRLAGWHTLVWARPE